MHLPDDELTMFPMTLTLGHSLCTLAISANILLQEEH